MKLYKSNEVDIELGIFDKIYDNLAGTDINQKYWDINVYNYIKSISIGLKIKLSALFIIKKENNFDNDVFILPKNINNFVDMENAKLSFITINDYINEIDNINNEPDKLVKLLVKKKVDEINDVILIINKTGDDINKLKEVMLIFKYYMLTRKKFLAKFGMATIDIDINFNTDIINSFLNINFLKDYVKEEYKNYTDILLHIEFILRFLNSGQELISTPAEHLEELIKSSETNITNLDKDLVTDVSSDLFKEFLEKIDFDFNLFTTDSKIKEITISGIKNFDKYVFDKKLIAIDFIDTLNNFSTFVNSEVWEIFKVFKDDNTLFGTLDKDIYNPSKKEYKFFFDSQSKYENIINNVYDGKNKNITINDPNLDSKMIISNSFNLDTHGTIKEFIDSFYKLIIEPDKTIIDNNIIKYILMNFNLTDKIKTVNLSEKDKNVTDNIETIIKLEKSIHSEMKSHTNFILELKSKYFQIK